MKRVIIFLAFILLCINSNSQVLLTNQGFIQNQDILENELSRNVNGICDLSSTSEILNDFSNETPYVINIFFHKIVADDGTTPDINNSVGQPYPDGIGEGDNIGENEFLEAIRTLNIKFNKFYIFFKYKGYDIIKESDFLDINHVTTPVLGDTNELIEYTKTHTDNQGNILYKQDCFNYFIVHRISPNYTVIGIPLTSWALIGIHPEGTNWIQDYTEVFLPYRVFQPVGEPLYGTPPPPPSTIINKVIPKMMGKNLKLLTIENNYGYNCNLPSYSFPNYAMENVTRDESNPKFNANRAGDHVIDTRAAIQDITAPEQFKDLDNCTCNNSLIVANNLKDYSLFAWNDTPPYNCYPNGEFYFDVPIFNYLTSALYLGHLNLETYIMEWDRCDSALHFTNGQGMRMRCMINYFQQFQNVLNMDGIASLYQPYKSTCKTNNDPIFDPIYLKSGLKFNVKRPNTPNTNCTQYFQPGFDYVINYCNPYSNPITVDDSYASYDVFSEIPSFWQPGKSIYINQLGDNNLENCTPFPAEINYNIIGGKTIEILPNTYNIDEKTAQEIDDEQLIQDLPSGIHTIEIKTETGETSQKTILK